MSDVPVWAWLIGVFLTGGFGASVVPAIVQAVTGRKKITAEVAQIEADTLVQLHPVWNETVKYLKHEIDELRAEAEELRRERDEDRKALARMQARLTRYERLMEQHGIPIPHD